MAHRYKLAFPVLKDSNQNLLAPNILTWWPPATTTALNFAPRVLIGTNYAGAVFSDYLRTVQSMWKLTKKAMAVPVSERSVSVWVCMDYASV